MNGDRPHHILRSSDLIDDPTLNGIVTYLQGNGGSDLNAIASQPGLDLDPLWTALARLQNRTYLNAPSAASPVDATFLTRDQATYHLVLGRKIEFQNVVLITPDPLLSASSLSELREELGAQVPGKRARITLEVCTPNTWKSLFDFCYPPTPYGAALTEHEAMALASLTPARELPPHLGGMLDQGLITHEQYAEAIARQLRLPYVNARLHPPDPSVFDFIPANIALATGVYPYRLTRDQRVIVLSPHAPDEGTLQRLRRLTQLGQDAVWALVSPRTYETLMASLEEERVYT